MRLPDRDHSSALLIVASGADVEQIEALREALTDPVFGGFMLDRCRILEYPETDEALATLETYTRSVRDTLLIYFAGQLAVDRDGQVAFVGTEPGGFAEVRAMFQSTSVANLLVIVDCTNIRRSDIATVGRELEKTGGSHMLASVTRESTSTFGALILRCLREGVPDGPEMISFDLLTELCRQEAREPVVRTGIGGEVALVRNRAVAPTVSAEFAAFYNAASPAARALVCRAALLEPDDTFAPELLLPDFTREQIDTALDETASSPLLAPSAAPEIRFAKPEYRAAAGAYLSAQPAETVAEIQFTLRQQRMIRTGVAPRPHLTRDYWTIDDQLEYRPYADAIAAFIRHLDTRPPLTIGVKGPWGAGKTSLMRMIRAELDDERPIELTSHSRARLSRRRHVEADTRVTNAEVLRHAAGPAADDEPLTVTRPSSGWRPTVWFNPWMYQNTEQVWAGLAHAIISQATDRLRPGDRERFWLELNLSRLDGLAVRRRAYRLFLERLLPIVVTFLLAAGAAAVMWVTGLAANLARWALAGGVGALPIGGLLMYCVFRRQQATAGFGQLLSGPVAGAVGTGVRGLLDAAVPDPGYSNRAGFLHHVQHDMTRVLRMVATESRPLVVFVDDLDRCSPRVVTEVIEAINLFLAGEFENCVFVVAMEPEVVAAHVEVAYSDLVTKLGKGNGELGWRFLEKIVQLPMNLPTVDDQRHVPGYLRALLGGGPVPTTPASQPETTRHQADGNDADQPAPPPLTAPNPVSAPMPAPSSEIVSWATARIRALKPTLDTLPDVIQRVVDEAPGHFPLTSAEPGAIRQLVLRAAEPVFGDLYTDNAAYDAIGAALPALRSSNPREIKRYVNLFRFYSFVTFPRHIDGAAPDNAQLAKLTALAIRWPDLLDTLSREPTAVDRLEQAADDNDEKWERLLTELGWTATPRLTDLRTFLVHGPRIGQIAHTVL